MYSLFLDYLTTFSTEAPKSRMVLIEQVSSGSNASVLHWEVPCSGIAQGTDESDLGSLSIFRQVPEYCL
jgi:hypothetical protein